MTATYSAEDYARAQAHITTDPWATRMLARTFASLRITHDARVTELLDANNRFEQRARLAERELDALNNQFGATARMLADAGRERDALKERIAAVGKAVQCEADLWDCGNDGVMQVIRAVQSALSS